MLFASGISKSSNPKFAPSLFDHTCHFSKRYVITKSITLAQFYRASPNCQTSLLSLGDEPRRALVKLGEKGCIIYTGSNPVRVANTCYPLMMRALFLQAPPRF